ncbi:fibronectin type III domain-containing protein [Nitriliruptoraceae bacterium ZYF776]|nr:fibronectin type III domain-containing protein [Profundirhabdus halotolerans]
MALLLVGALIATLVALGEPSRPATADIVRPIVTVPALCSAPTVIDVAAREASRGLVAVGQLLGVDDELAGEAARDLRTVDTEAGTFFVLVRDGEVRVAALSPTGLPIVDTFAETPRTYRVFGLPDELDGAAPPVVVPGVDGVFVVFGDADRPARVLVVTPGTLATGAEVTLATDASAPTLPTAAARPGAAVAADGVLWLAGDDRLVSYDPYADEGERWTVHAEDLAAPLVAADGDGVAVVAEGAEDAEGDGGVEVQRFAAGDEDPVATTPQPDVVDVVAASFPGSAAAAFLVTTDGGPAVLRPGAGEDALAAVPTVDGDAVGLVAVADASAVMHDTAGRLAYQVVDRAGTQVGTFGAAAGERCVPDGWPDAAGLVRTSSAGTLLHLHDPGATRDCVVDANDPAELAETGERCGPDGPWSVDKGSAPARDFSVEIGRALDEVAADAAEDERRAEQPEEELPAGALREELGEAGIEVVETEPELEVDPDAADVCAAEQVEVLAPPVLDLAEPVGSRAVRVEWTWNGGECLPGSYVVTLCQLATQGSSCADTTEREVDAPRESARSAIQLDARPDRTYRVTVRARKDGAVSDPSGALLVTVPPATPDPPRDVSATLRDGRWQLSWSSCLAGGGCDQRPDGFVVTVEGCEGDGLGQQRRRFDVGQRSASFGADGDGFGTDLLGRRVRFHVMTTAGERVSEPVAGNGCTASVRPGRDADAGTYGARLTGRSRTVTLAALQGGRPALELFGTRDYDDVNARLVRGSFRSGARSGILRGPASFEVDRCLGRGWTVELTPTLGGRELPNHRARLTDAAIACDPSVDSSTRVSAEVTGSGSGGIDLRVNVPELGQDAANELVSGVSASATCATAFGGERRYDLSGGTIRGDDVSFRMPAPAVLDLRSACRVAPVVAFSGGGSAAPSPVRVDLRRAGGVIVEAVLPVAADRLTRARTGSYERRGLPLPGLGGRDVVVVRHDGSGVPCNRSFGSSRWTFEVAGTSILTCGNGVHALAFGERDLDGAGRGELQLRARVHGSDGGSASLTQRIDVCGLPSGEPRPPCAQPEPCEYDPSLPADDPDCVPPPCEHDPSLPADHPDCVPPEEPPGDDPPGDDPPGDDPPADGGRRATTGPRR